MKLENMAFPPGSVWMQIVEATYLFLGHGVVGSTSGSILHSGDSQGGQCPLTPFKTVQVITSPDNEVHLKDPTSREFICRLKNVALSLREATGYISCESELYDAEMEMYNLIKTTDNTSSMLLNEEPKPAVTVSPKRDNFISTSTSAFPVREKRKLPQFPTADDLLYSQSSVQHEYTVSNTIAPSLSSEVSNTAKSNDSSLHFVETPQPRMIIRESSLDISSPTVVLYGSQEIESRLTPKPSLYSWHFSQTSTTVNNSITVPLSINLQPTATVSEYVSPIEFSSSEDELVFTSDIPSETTMVFGGVQHSLFSNIDVELDASVDNLIGTRDSSFVPQNTMIEYLMVTATVAYEDYYDAPQYDETGEDSVYMNSNYLQNSFTDFSQRNDDQSTAIMTTLVSEPSNILVTVRKGTSSHPKKASLNKPSQAPVKMVSTNEEIQKRILSFLYPITNIFTFFKDSPSQELDASELQETTSNPHENLSVKGRNYIDKHASVSLDFSTSTTKVPEWEISRFFWSVLKNETYPEVDESDNSGLSSQNGNGMPNDILNYVSRKTNVSLKASDETNKSSSILPTSQRNHSSSDISSLNSPVNLSYVRRLSETGGDTRDEVNFALPVTTGKSLHSDVNMVSVSEDIHSQEAAKSQRSTWILFIGGGIVLQVQLIIGLVIIWCCLRRKFKRYVDTEEPANIYDGFSKVVNFRNSGKISDDPEKCSAHAEENESGSTSDGNAKLPKCLTTSL